MRAVRAAGAAGAAARRRARHRWQLQLAASAGNGALFARGGVRHEVGGVAEYKAGKLIPARGGCSHRAPGELSNAPRLLQQLRAFPVAATRQMRRAGGARSMRHGWARWQLPAPLLVTNSGGCQQH